MGEPILEVKSLTKTFVDKNLFGKVKGGVSAVSDVSFTLRKNKTLGVVGESGCGKSTLARLIMRLIEPDQGKAVLKEVDLLKLNRKQFKLVRRNIQMVFQNPYSSLNPKLTILENVEFPLIANNMGSKEEIREIALKYIEAVGLSTKHAHRYPTGLSGGQRQRVAIARALVLQPEILIADEAVSALDKSVQAQVLNLFQDLKEQFDLSMIFISHDLHVVEYMSDEVLVMYLGKVMEKGTKEQVFNNPQHPYTKALLASSPKLELEHSMPKSKDKYFLNSDLPSPYNPPSGCRFRTRCPHAKKKCALNVPDLQQVEDGHFVSCILYES